MSYTILSLASGQLPDTTAAIFTATAPTIVKDITLVNTDSAERTVNLYLKRASSTIRSIIPFDLILGVHYKLDTADESFTLSTGDSIHGDSDVALKVDYTISGTYK